MKNIMTGMSKTINILFSIFFIGLSLSVSQDILRNAHGVMTVWIDMSGGTDDLTPQWLVREYCVELHLLF